MSGPPRLNYALVRSDKGEPGQASEALLFLHGILGSGANLRSLAQQLVQRAPHLAVALVDLRGHGRSEHGTAPHTVARCAADLAQIEAALELPITGVVGHSFGGKVALAYLQLQPDLSRVVLLDSAPFARPERVGSEQTMAIIAMLESAPTSFATRTEFITFVHAQGYSRAIADWLAMNLARADQGFRLRVDLAQIRALLDDYFTLDLWPVVEHASAQIDLVIAAQSDVYGPRELREAESLAAHSHGRVRVQRVKDAGHWVHVDAPAAVLDVLTSANVGSGRA